MKYNIMSDAMFSQTDGRRGQPLPGSTGVDMMT